MIARFFLLPFILAGAAQADFSLQDRPADGQMDFLKEGKIIGRYMYGRDRSDKQKTVDTSKTYLHVFDSEGKGPITKGAGGELPHHRGIFIGWNKLTVNGKSTDLWHMNGGGEQLHEKFMDGKSGPDGAGVTSWVSWKDKSGATLVAEKRTMVFGKAPAPAYAVVDFSSTLTAVAGDVALDGDPEHAGLQYRPANEVIREKTRFLFPKADANPMTDLDYPWVMESYFLGEKTYHVVYLNHLENLAGTRFSAYRDYGRFGAFFKGTIPKGESLKLKVRFLITEGDAPEVAWIQEQSNAFTGKIDPVPATTLKESKARAVVKPKAATKGVPEAARP